MDITEQSTVNIIEITTPNDCIIVEKKIVNVVEIGDVELPDLDFRIMQGETSAIITHGLGRDHLRVLFTNNEGVLVRPLIRYIDATSFEVCSNSPMFGRLVFQ